MSKIKEYFQGLVKKDVIPQEPANYDAATLKIYIDHLESENAALHERLDKAVEIPDYVFECINGKVEIIFTEYLTVGELKNLEANGYSLTKEAAEARLAEQKGGKER